LGKYYIGNIAPYESQTVELDSEDLPALQNIGEVLYFEVLAVEDENFTGDNNDFVYLSSDNSCSITGSIKSFGDASATTTVQILRDNNVVKTTSITGNSGTYTFNDLAPGTYTIRVSKSKHCTRDYSVTINNAKVTQNLEIWQYGDVNGDGTVNHIDVLQINRNIASQTSVFDAGTDDLKAYRFKVANVTAINGTDTVLNHIDVLQINRKIANLTSIFDSLS